MSRKRQQQHSEEIKSRILDISQRIISEEGLEALSIRPLPMKWAIHQEASTIILKVKMILFYVYYKKDIKKSLMP